MNVAGVLDVDIRIDNTLQASLLVDEKQARYATMLALNRMAEEVNVEGRRQIQARMLVRVPAFVLPPLMLPRVWRATKENLAAFIALGDTSRIGTRRRAILEKFETGGEKVAREHDRPVVVPTSAIRPSPRSLVDRRLYPKNLGLIERQYFSRRTKKVETRRATTKETVSGRQVVGKLRTFVLDPARQRGLKPGAWGVWQRVGPRRDDIRLIWSYRQRVHIPDIMDFIPMARQLVEARFEINWRAFYALAQRTAK